MNAAAFADWLPALTRAILPDEVSVFFRHRIAAATMDANKVAHYMLRWVNTRGEKGPWSETVSATIGA